MNSIILIFKGFIIGIGKVLPGVSGSLLAFSLGVYEDAIDAITYLFFDIRRNIIYLCKICLGALIAILLFSKIIMYFINNYYAYTIILFVGLICGTIPYVFKKTKLSKKINLIYVILAMLFVFSLNIFKSSNIYTPNNSLLDYLYMIVMGFIDAATMIIPGISGTATFMLLGCYNFVLKLFSNPFANIFYSFLFGVGLLIGVFIVSKMISYLLKKHSEQLFLSVIGFSISSIIYLVINISKCITLHNIIPLIILYISGFIISYKLGEL